MVQSLWLSAAHSANGLLPVTLSKRCSLLNTTRMICPSRSVIVQWMRRLLTIFVNVRNVESGYIKLSRRMSFGGRVGWLATAAQVCLLPLRSQADTERTRLLSSYFVVKTRA